MISTLLAVDLMLRPFISANALEFTDDVNSVGPNPPMKVGLAVDYNGIGGSFSTSVRTMRDEEVYGKTDARDFSIYWYGEQWGADLVLQWYDGLHGANCADDLQPGECDIFPGARARRAAATVYRTFDDTFSPKVAFAQARKPSGSGGSWVAMAGIDHADFDSGAGTNVRLSGAGIGGGYGHLWISDGGWYFSPLLMVGLGPAWLDLDGEDPERGLRLAIKPNIKASAGYHGERFYAGFVAAVDGISAGGDEENPGFQWQSIYAEWFLGFRL